MYKRQGIDNLGVLYLDLELLVEGRAVVVNGSSSVGALIGRFPFYCLKLMKSILIYLKIFTIFRYYCTYTAASIPVNLHMALPNCSTCPTTSAFPLHEAGLATLPFCLTTALTTVISAAEN